MVAPGPPPKVEKTSWDEFAKFIEQFTPEMAEKASGCPKESIIKAARWFAQSKATMSMWCMGLNQRTRGVWANNLVHNLHLLTGQICRPGLPPSRSPASRMHAAAFATAVCLLTSFPMAGSLQMRRIVTIWKNSGACRKDAFRPSRGLRQ